MMPTALLAALATGILAGFLAAVLVLPWRNRTHMDEVREQIRRMSK